MFNTIERPKNVDEQRAENTWAGNQAVLQQLCGRVKFRSSRHTSISALGLVLIVSFSGLLMLISFAETSLPFIRRSKRWRFIVEWERDDMLALLSKAETEVMTGR
jgi:hypothetical protein